MATPTMPKAARGLRVLTDAVLDGLSIEDIKCRSCSGYGNCGFKSMFMKPEGGVVSICMNRRKQMQEKLYGEGHVDPLMD